MTNVCRYKVTAEEKIHLKTQWNIPWQYTKETENKAQGSMLSRSFKKLLFVNVGMEKEKCPQWSQ